MSAPYDSCLVARYIVATANDRDIYINLTKVQKLLYVAYGVWLAIVSDTPLVNEKPQAWPYGPVFPKTRKYLMANELYLMKLDDSDFNELKQDENFIGLIDFVFLHWGHLTAGQLTSWSHMDGSPWEEATMKEGFDWGDRISDTSIKSYFRYKALRRKDDGN